VEIVWTDIPLVIAALNSKIDDEQIPPHVAHFESLT